MRISACSPKPRAIRNWKAWAPRLSRFSKPGKTMWQSRAWATAAHISGTMAVGVGSAIRIRYYAIQLRPEDVIMLSSDGLHGVIRTSDIESILVRDSALEDQCRALIAAAHEAGSPDNVTVVLLRAAAKN